MPCENKSEHKEFCFLRFKHKIVNKKGFGNFCIRCGRPRLKCGAVKEAIRWRKTK